jgi:hypothetical protein
MTPKFETRRDAQRAGWLTLSEATAALRRAGFSTTDREPAPGGEFFGYGLWIVCDGQRRRVPTSTVSLTAARNKIGQIGAYATMVRATTVDELIGQATAAQRDSCDRT